VSAHDPLRALDSDEVRELAAFLDSPDVDCLSFNELGGFLTAVVSAPTTFRPSEWQGEAFGDQAFESIAQAQHILDLVIRLHNGIIMTLDAGEPLLGDANDDTVADWCSGYMHGARMDPAWTRDPEGVVFLFPLAILSGEFDLVGEEDADGNIIEDATPQLQKARAKLEETVLAAYEHFRTRRLAPGVARSAPKIGRNEPCPCGSGRKFKKCCGPNMRT
jgi:uncharacterized protein